MKWFIFFLITIYSLSVFAENSTLERIHLYRQESSRYMSIGDYLEACEYLKVAHELAINEKIDGQLMQKIEASKKKSCSMLKIQTDSERQARDKRFACERYGQIIRSCAEAGDIDGCVKIKSGGVNLKKMNMTCQSN